MLLTSTYFRLAWVDFAQREDEGGAEGGDITGVSSVFGEVLGRFGGGFVG